jgi:hypothetical protein
LEVWAGEAVGLVWFAHVRDAGDLEVHYAGADEGRDDCCGKLVGVA